MIDLLKPTEVAEKLRVSEVTLTRWRKQKIGPAFVKLSGGIIRYPVEAIQQYLTQSLQGGTQCR